MRSSYIGIVIAILLLIAAIVGYSTFFTVYQTRQALVIRLGEPVRVITEPGLNVKIPFIDNVIYIDKRILAVESQAHDLNLAHCNERCDYLNCAFARTCFYDFIESLIICRTAIRISRTILFHRSDVNLLRVQHFRPAYGSRKEMKKGTVAAIKKQLGLP